MRTVVVTGIPRPSPADLDALAPLGVATVHEALGRTGVERFGVLAGDAYDPVRHRPMGTEPVTDPALDGTVASVLTDGFELGEQVVRRAEVRVGRLTERDSEGS